jgi:hypothetical protein
MISLDRHRILTLRQASDLIPRLRDGRPTHPSTIARWIGVGLWGVRLEGIRVGASLCTSAEALQEFFDELTRVGASPADADGAEIGSEDDKKSHDMVVSEGHHEG